jgi:FixJ family two-component response regulator
LRHFRIEKIFIHIIDDDESVQKGLSRLMRSIGVESRTYESSKHFLEEVHNESHACILMDMNMPHMSGLELAGQLQQRSIKLPVIAISARDDDEIRQLARDLGVKFFLRKPVDDQALIDAISWVMQNSIGP